MEINKNIALFSVAPHPEIEFFARTLIDAGWLVIATKDAAFFLKEKNLKVTDVSEFTGVKEDYGFPPTLHAKMEAALTTDFHERVELVYDIPYGLDVGNDVGGRALLALASKGNRIPVMTSEDMHRVVGQIAKRSRVNDEFSAYLRAKANHEISEHYREVSSLSMPMEFQGMSGSREYELMNGENMYQSPAFLYRSDNDDPLSIVNFSLVSGNKPCFTNVADLDCILETLCKVKVALECSGIVNAFITVASKHGNPCGCGISLEQPGDAINSALWGNPRAIWGGEVITNFTIDDGLADRLKSSTKRKELLGSAPWMLDLIAVPSMSGSAIDVLSSNKNRKLFINEALSSPAARKEKQLFRQLRGGFLSQPPFEYVLDLKKLRWSIEPEKNVLESISLIIAWAVAFSSFHGGNEIALVRDGRLLSAGGGPSTHDAAKTAITRAEELGHDLKGSVFGADAFFPFTDVPEILYEAGCTAGTVPSGGTKEADVIGYFKDKGMSVGFISERYRGFCRH